MRLYIGGSPYIEIKHQKIRALGKGDLAEVDESATDWERVEAIYDYVLENVEYVEGPDKGALDALRDGQADCQGRSMLFIALCRANKIPARMVWVDGHAYPEFYLEDADGQGLLVPVRIGRHAGVRRDAARADRSCKRATTSACPSGRKTGSATRRITWSACPSATRGKPKAKFIREPVAD